MIIFQFSHRVQFSIWNWTVWNEKLIVLVLSLDFSQNHLDDPHFSSCGSLGVSLFACWPRMVSRGLLPLLVSESGGGLPLPFKCAAGSGQRRECAGATILFPDAERSKNRFLTFFRTTLLSNKKLELMRSWPDSCERMATLRALKAWFEKSRDAENNPLAPSGSSLSSSHTWKVSSQEFLLDEFLLVFASILASLVANRFERYVAKMTAVSWTKSLAKGFSSQTKSGSFEMNTKQNKATPWYKCCLDADANRTGEVHYPERRYVMAVWIYNFRLCRKWFFYKNSRELCHFIKFMKSEIGMTAETGELPAFEYAKNHWFCWCHFTS